VLILLFL
jgi:hypothetical protein